MGTTRETQVAQGQNSRAGSTGNLRKRRPYVARTGAVFRDAPVFASGYFAWTKFLVGALSPFNLTRQVLSRFHSKSQPNCIGDGD
jgi:hypothetical protein